MHKYYIGAWFYSYALNKYLKFKVLGKGFCCRPVNQLRKSFTLRSNQIKDLIAKWIMY
jgi:hypothetical protein